MSSEMRNKYKVWCEDDAKWECVYDHICPTACPTNGAHTVTAAKTAIIDDGDTSGFAVYYDDTTPTTPISVTKNTWTTITNDAAGSNTITDNLSHLVDKLFDGTTNSFFLEDLRVGEELEVRVSIEITTVTACSIEMDLYFDTGTLQFSSTYPTVSLGASTTKSEAFSFEFYIADADVRDATVIARIKTTEDVDVEVSNFYVKVLKK